MDRTAEEPRRVVLEEGTGEITEKKSRFIATVKRVESEEEAAAFTEAMKKKYWDASHNCSAVVLGKRGEWTRSSDDGEPSGTAGRPMLEVLLGERLRDVAVVVTRYFGGTLLGTGGLARAYAGAVKAGLAACRLGTVLAGVRMSVETDYTGIGRILRLLEERGIRPLESLYAEKVTLTLPVPLEQKEALEKEITEATAGRAGVTILDEIEYIAETGAGRG